MQSYQIRFKDREPMQCLAGIKFLMCQEVAINAYMHTGLHAFMPPTQVVAAFTVFGRDGQNYRLLLAELGLREIQSEFPWSSSVIASVAELYCSHLWARDAECCCHSPFSRAVRGDRWTTSSVERRNVLCYNIALSCKRSGDAKIKTLPSTILFPHPATRRLMGCQGGLSKRSVQQLPSSS